MSLLQTPMSSMLTVPPPMIEITSMTSSGRASEGITEASTALQWPATEGAAQKWSAPQTWPLMHSVAAVHDTVQSRASGE